MVWIINQRTAGQGGAIKRPECFKSAGGQSVSYDPFGPADVDRETDGKQVVIAIHGFNVNRPEAVNIYARLQDALNLAGNQVFFGVVWPGDGWIPVVNYPWEAGDAARCGRELAAWLTAAMPRAGSFNFLSHSLGARVLLEAVQALDESVVGRVCITAGAVDDDVLSDGYAAIKSKADRVAVLSSRMDAVLTAAYPLGDLVSDVFLGDKDSPWHGALGLRGPNPTEARAKVAAGQIHWTLNYGHGDYFPPWNGVGGEDWKRSVAYMRRALNSAPGDDLSVFAP